MNKIIYIIIWPMVLVWRIEDKIGVKFNNVGEIFTVLWVILLFLAFIRIAFPVAVILDRLVWCGQGLESIYGCN